MRTLGVLAMTLIFGAGFYVAWAQNAESGSKKNQYQTISPAEARKRLDNEKGIVLLDVRTPEEYREGHVPGSILLPVDELEAKIAGIIPDKQTTVFVYCRSGRRSAIAANTMIKLGYSSVYDLGGIVDWPYQTEKGNK